ncbi:hypothetical protein MferCBS31731_004483 [Microsporum ferrugineum]
MEFRNYCEASLNNIEEDKDGGTSGPGFWTDMSIEYLDGKTQFKETSERQDQSLIGDSFISSEDIEKRTLRSPWEIS